MSADAGGGDSPTTGKMTIPVPGIGTIELAGGLPTILIILGAVGIVVRPHFPQIAIFTGVLVVGLAWRAIVWLRRPRSRLVTPAAPKKVHTAFVGREREVVELTNLLMDTPIVWITGESGAGKSWLVSKGVLPALESRTECIPLYMSAWGSTWDEGPTRGLAKAVSELSSKRGVGLSVADPGSTAEVLGSIRTLSAKSGAIVIIVFDQLDDYLVQHRDRFISRSGRVVSLEKLRRANRFWDELAALVSEGSTHCAFVSRQDLQWARGSLRLDDRDEDFFVSRLGADVVEQLLLDLTSGGAVSLPDVGWTALRAQICHDLADSDGVLPIQMKFAVESLYLLQDDLSVGNYRKHGGINGLVAEHLRSTLARVGKKVGGDKSTWLSLLLRLTDGRKTRSLREDELAPGIDEHLTPDRLLDGLAFLKQNEILRDIVEPEDRTRRWRLDHDYLVEVVSYLKKQQNPLQYELAESMERWRRALSLPDRARMLLRPATVCKVLLARISGNINISSAHKYVLLSVGRALLTMWVIIPAVAGAAAWEWYVNREISRYFDVIGLGENQGKDEAQALWDLTSKPRAVRAGVLNRFFDNETNAARFDVRSWGILSAVAGTNQRDWRSIPSGVLHQRCQPMLGIDDARALACGSLWFLSEDRDGAAYFLRTAMADHKINDEGAALALLFGYVARPQDEDRVIELLKSVTPVMTQKDNPQTRALGLVAFVSLAKAVNAGRRAEFASNLVEALGDEEDEDVRGLFLSAFRALVNSLDAQHRSHVLATVVGKVSAESDPSDRLNLLRVLGAIPTTSTGDQELIAPVIQRLRAHLAQDYEGPQWRLNPYLASLAILKVPLSTREEAMFGRSLEKAGLWRGPPASERGVDFVSNSLASYKSCTDIAERVKNLGPITTTLDKSVLRRLGEQFVLSMRYENSGWCEGAAADLAPGLDPDLVSAAIDQKLQRLEKGEDAYSLEFIHAKILLKPLCPKAPRKESERVANRLIAILEKEADGSRFNDEVTIFQSLAPTLSSSSSNIVFGSLLDQMNREEAPERKRGWADILASIAPNLEDSVAEAALPKLLSRLVVQATPNCKAVSTLLRKGTIAQGVEVVRWPTCSGPDRALLVRRILELAGKRKDSPNDLEPPWALSDRDDWWLFMEWLHSDARKQHLINDPDRRPAHVVIRG